ncbi:hypothetical protein BZG36_02749 [Bifiguratus adelaidae]|uniref:Serine/threonine-protein kinase 19 n=1 Tax=Bifiguratus adelaidae TaxID=1938954 RepID=A0A261XYN0_9FUNG|nr:hypothetical protein BZG36_02749 [Bifiguratus adelaidae]
MSECRTIGLYVQIWQLRLDMFTHVRKSAHARVVAYQSRQNVDKGNTTNPDVFGVRNAHGRKRRLDELRSSGDSDSDTAKRNALTSEQPGTASDGVTSSELTQMTTLEAFHYVTNTLWVPNHATPAKRAALAKLPKMCMVSHLYAVIPDNTRVDRELTELIREGILRQFRLGGSQEDEFALLLTSDYIAQIQAAHTEYTSDRESGKDKNPLQASPDLFLKFEEYVIQSLKYTDVTITKTELKFAIQASDADISKLIMHGLLTIKQPDQYWFSIRGAGHFMGFFLKGRKNMLRMCKRKKMGECLWMQITAKPIRDSVLGYEFHLLDLVGSGRVDCINTTMGRLIRITHKGLDFIQIN